MKTLFQCCSAFFMFAAACCAQDSDRDKRYEFFEKRIRPVLVKHCYSCHAKNAKKVRGKLLLDTRAGIRKGGESGPAVVPGDVKKSLLIGAIRHETFEMPPKSRLTKRVVDDFVKWIKSGAPDPRDGRSATAKTGGIDIAKARQFWAFQKPRQHKLPRVKNAAWPRSHLDRFILAGLEAKGLKPVEDADRRTLLRRVTFDLTGLPPTPKELRDFLNDSAPDAFAKVVDRLLASPHFGEHWGRHWLDLARYADSNGGDINLTFRNAWRYRDYVVNAFNTDKRFDRFIVEQLAGDLVPTKDATRRSEQMIASGYLIVGPKMLSERDKEKLRMDVVDEQLDSVGRTFLGMTLGCARCHDHKFDPIPTTDYYALAGIFRSTITVQGIRMNNVNVSGWVERALPIPPAQQAALDAYNRRLTALNRKINALRKTLGRMTVATVVASGQLPGIVVDDVDAKLVGSWKKSKFVARYVGKGYVHDEKMDKGRKSITFTPAIPKAGEYEVRISYAGGKGRDNNVPVTIRHAKGTTTVSLNQSKQPDIGGLFRSIGRFHFAAGKVGSVTIATTGTKGFVIADAVQFLPIDKLPVAKQKPVVPKAAVAARQKELQQLERKLSALKKTAPKPAAMCMAPQDRDKPADCKLRIRGEPHNVGAVVPRGYLTVIGRLNTPAVNASQSGRLELAKWIASPDNPLTARVTVNRIWHHLFGSGLVRSVDNFGRLGARPSHPELLDRLAIDFVKDGWSVKRAIRRIVLSRTYQLRGDHSHAAMGVDPQNLLLWRHNRRRLTAESIRDAMLAVSGRLDRTAGGSAVAGYGEQAVANNLKNKGGGTSNGARFRRSLYLPIVRNDLPAMLTVFDFADPDTVTGARNVTTVPAQALLMMNSDFVKASAASLAGRALQTKDRTDDERLQELYELALGRQPTRKEVTRALDYLRSQADDTRKIPAAAWTRFCHALLASTEFRFVE